MTSEAKKAANQSNAIKSTGPRTDSGKTRSSLNAVKAGIYATTPLLPGEDRAALREIEKANLDYFNPIGPVETLLVGQITAEHWKLGRIDRAEVALFRQLRTAEYRRFLGSLNQQGQRYAASLTKSKGEARKRQGSREASRRRYGNEPRAIFRIARK